MSASPLSSFIYSNILVHHAAPSIRTMKKTSRFVPYVFYLQLLLIISSGGIFASTYATWNELNIILTGAPAIILAPFILVLGLTTLIKQHKASFVVWAAICTNGAAGMFFLFLLFFGKRYF